MHFYSNNKNENCLGYFSDEFIPSFKDIMHLKDYRKKHNRPALKFSNFKNEIKSMNFFSAEIIKLLPILVFVNKVLQEHNHAHPFAFNVVYGCFHPMKAELH